MNAEHKDGSWQAGSLRATAFYSGELNLGALDWFQRLTGKPGDSKTVRPSAGQLVERGPLGEQTLQLQVQIGRIDWLLSPKDDPDVPEFTVLGNIEEWAPRFEQTIVSWLGMFREINRLAFGAQLFWATSDQQEGMRIISKMVPHLGIDLEGVHDFALQLNRPEQSKILRDLNRLVKWQTVLRKKMSGILSTAEPSAGLKTLFEDNAVLWELDISTAAPKNPSESIPADRLPDAFAELIQNALEIYSKGGL